MGWERGPSRQHSVDAQLVLSSGRADLHLHFTARVESFDSVLFVFAPIVRRVVFLLFSLSEELMALFQYNKPEKNG